MPLQGKEADHRVGNGAYTVLKGRILDTLISYQNRLFMNSYCKPRVTAYPLLITLLSETVRDAVCRPHAAYSLFLSVADSGWQYSLFQDADRQWRVEFVRESAFVAAIHANGFEGTYPERNNGYPPKEEIMRLATDVAVRIRLPIYAVRFYRSGLDLTDVSIISTPVTEPLIETV